MTALAGSAAIVVERFKRRILELNSSVDVSIVLIGSVARGTALSTSDLDLLVLSEQSVVQAKPEAPLHVQYFTVGEFIARMSAGDDFVAWCVRFGLPLVGSALWTAVLQAPESSSWPDWRLKIPHAARRLHTSANLLTMGDADAASEEALYALTHVGRAVLLHANQFPLSRPEMIAQLAEAERPTLSMLLKEFLYSAPDVRRVRQVIGYLKRLLVGLDRQWYAADAAERRRVSAKKAVMRARSGASSSSAVS